MSESQKAFGLTREALEKIEAKYDENTEKTCMEWVDAVIGEKIYTKTGSDAVHEILRDGTILCTLMNKLKPGSIKAINPSKLAFKQMENINNFLKAAEVYGVSNSELFQTVDLYEKKNMHQVLIALMSLARRAQSNNFNGPVIGPKEATKCPREFSEEQLREGKTIIGLQMGTNKGATQSGQNFGKTRSILD
ncbi:hypothetical protein HZS_2788 [Henneguya salminicola]|nr:hypothetical protein HZS_2788 [Henneguya salminicola]